MKVTIQAGKYYLGDPCYSFNGSLDDIYKQSKSFTNPLFVIDGHQLVVFKTAYGDGEYPSNTGRRFCVDSGTIGLVPIDMAENEEPFSTMIVEFREPTLCKRVKGKLYFGHIVIDTN